jgi:ABC-2 type transport system permease protein
VKFVAALTLHSLRRFRSLLLAAGLILAAFQVLLVEVGAYLDRTGSFSGFVTMFPAFVREAMGATFFSFLSFAGIVSLGYFHIAVLSALTGIVIALATEPAAEIEGGFADLVLAKAVGRHVPITRTVLVLLMSVTSLLATMVAGTLAGLALLASPNLTYSTKALFSLAANLGALLLCWGGIAMAAGTVVRRRAVAATVAGMMAFAGLLLDYLGRLWKPATNIAQLSPFRRYDPLQIILTGVLPARDIEILLAIAVAGVIAAYVVYARRDL